jgi:hypothetical protein
MEYSEFFKGLFTSGLRGFKNFPTGVKPASALLMMGVLLLHDVFDAYVDPTGDPSWREESENSYRRILVLALSAMMAAAAGAGNFGDTLTTYWTKVRETLCQGMQH